MQAITGDSVVLKFEKARCALGESLRRVKEIVPQDIGCQVILTCFSWPYLLLSSSCTYFMLKVLVEVFGLCATCSSCNKPILTVSMQVYMIC